MIAVVLPKPIPIPTFPLEVEGAKQSPLFLCVSVPLW